MHKRNVTIFKRYLKKKSYKMVHRVGRSTLETWFLVSERYVRGFHIKEYIMCSQQFSVLHCNSECLLLLKLSYMWRRYIKWELGSYFYQTFSGSLLGPALFSTFLSSMDSGIGWNLSGLTDNTKLWGAVNLLERREGMSSWGTLTGLRGGTGQTSWSSTAPRAGPAPGSGQAQVQAG